MLQTDRDTHWFEYFPGNYMWSQAMVLAIGFSTWRASDFGDIDRAGRRLRRRGADNNHWFEEWERIAVEAEQRARSAEENGRIQTASDANFRAATYHFMAERFLSHEDGRKIPAYLRSLRLFFACGSCRHTGL